MIRIFSLVLLISAFSASSAQHHQYLDSLQDLYSYRDEPYSIVLPSEDSAFHRVQLDRPIHFYSEKYDHIYINTNGILSFVTEFPEFLNQPFPLEYASIAPFYSNVDLSGGNGSIVFFKSENPHKLQKASELVRDAFTDHANFEANVLYVATWENVGYYEAKSDKANTFQAVIICNDEGTFVQFIYPWNGLNWLQADSGSSGLPDIRAQAGFISEDGRFFTLEGSATENARYLNALSNVEVPGVWLYRVGNLDYESNVEGPNNPSLQRDEREQRSCAEGLSKKCHPSAVCIDKPDGFCCECNEGYYGNGFSCIKSTVPIRVSGSISGSINDRTIDERAKLQSYVVINDGRSYTAVNPVDTEIGNSLKLATPIGGSIGWLFAKPVGGHSKNSVNGYHLTGGKLNHLSTIRFVESGEVLQVNQSYEGLNVWDQLTVRIEVSGRVPELHPGSRVLLKDYTDAYVFTDSNRVQSSGRRAFQLPDENRQIEFDLEQVITFERCQNYDQQEPEEDVPLFQKISKVSLDYFPQEQALRTGQVAKISTNNEVNPCEDGTAVCGANTLCNLNNDDDGYECVCMNGFAPDQLDGSVQNCVDIDECRAEHICSENAYCQNSAGGYSCVCHDGYYGNGYDCQPLDSSQYENRAGQYEKNAEQYERERQREREQYEANTPEYTTTARYEHPYGPSASQEVDPNPIEGHPCEQCSRDALCIDQHRCECRDGFNGDGVDCTYNCRRDENWVEGHCVPTYRPSEEVEVPPYCLDDSEDCTCPQGYELIEEDHICRLNNYDSESKSEEQIPCDVEFNCHPNATCEWSDADMHFICVCQRGFEGDGYTCHKLEVSCTTNPDLCDPHASCVYVEQIGKSQCKCDKGYEGSGHSCQLAPECDVDEHCGENAVCDGGVCQCREGFERDASDFCVPAGKCGGAYCADNAICKFEPAQRVQYCECLEGYVGDGLESCKSVPPPCNVRNTCGLHAACAPSYQEYGKYECVCDPGYYGDGYVCIEERNCRNTPAICDPNAQCVSTGSGLSCVCNTGFLGNGTVCKEITTHESGFLLISQGVVIIRVPFNGKGGKPISVASMAIGLDKDCVEGRVYWGDISTKKIMSAKYDGSDSRTFISEDIESPEGIAIDSVSRRLYWADSTKDTIEVASLDNPAMRAVLIHKHLVNPRGIAVDPQRNKLYWSDWNRAHPKIEMSDLDGTSREILLSKPNLVLPNSLVVVQNTGELCYVDAGTQRAECIDTYSKEIRTIADNLKYPFGLTSTDEHFYWTDWKTKQVESVDIYGKRQQGLRTPFFGSHKMYGMTAIVESCPLSQSPCLVNNGGCPDDRLCLVNYNAPSSKSCKCSKLSKLCNSDQHLDY